MGVSTDGQICYGVLFEEGFHFPWGESYDIEDWWMRTSGYKPSVEIYNEKGEYINGVRPERSVLDNYFEERGKFRDEHPVPVEMVNACSYDYPVWIVALKETFFKANRGYPVIIKEENIIITEEQRTALLDFFKKFDIDIEGKEPNWYLSSYWG